MKYDHCILHIGSPKTGSTSIQYSFYDHREYLNGLGYFYPSNSANHFFFTWHFVKSLEKYPGAKIFYEDLGLTTTEAIEEYRSWEFEQLETSLKDFNGSTIIFSSELLPFLSKDACIRMKSYLSSLAKKITIICYVRHPMLQCISRAQQRLQSGRYTFSEVLQDLNHFSPRELLPTFVSVFGRDNIIVRPFEKNQLFKECVVLDICKTIGLKDESAEKIRVGRLNESLSMEGALLTDSLNRQFPRYVNGCKNPERAEAINMRDIQGVKFNLPPSTYEQIKESADEELKYLREEFNISLADPQIPLGKNASWGMDTIDSLVFKLNKTMLVNQNLRVANSMQKGKIFIKTDKPKRAIECFRKALKLRANHWEALKLLVYVLRSNGQENCAELEIKKFKTLNPNEDRLGSLQ